MGKKKRKETEIEVEDHGNGFLIIGTNSILKAKEILADYVDDVTEYRFACPSAGHKPSGRSAVWLTPDPGGMWEGSSSRPIGD